jgi:hypothetical protein
MLTQKTKSRKTNIKKKKKKKKNPVKYTSIKPRAEALLSRTLSRFLGLTVL